MDDFLSKTGVTFLQSSYNNYLDLLKTQYTKESKILGTDTDKHTFTLNIILHFFQFQEIIFIISSFILICYLV